MTDDQAPHDWRPLRSVFYALNSDVHPLYFAFLLPDYRESAIANAVRSGVVPVRGCLAWRIGGSDSFRAPEEIKGLNKDAEVNVLRNEITVRETYVGKLFENGILDVKKTVDAETYVSVEADQREVEQWLRKYALPRGWREPAADGASQSRRGRPPKFDWNAVREETFRLMDHHGDFTDDDQEWNAQAQLEKVLIEFCRKKFKKGSGVSTLRGYIVRWLNEWRKQKQTVRN